MSDPVASAIFLTMLKNMNSNQRRRAEILGELENIPFAVQGKICENRKTLANGTVAVYHNLQWWQDGKNHAVHIPEDRLAEFEQAVKGGKRAKELLMETSRGQPPKITKIKHEICKIFVNLIYAAELASRQPCVEWPISPTGCAQAPARKQLPCADTAFVTKPRPPNTFPAPI
jgi:hypothetical protein